MLSLWTFQPTWPTLLLLTVRGRSLAYHSWDMLNGFRRTERDLDCVVQPGVPYEVLNDTLAEHKLLFGVDP